MAQADAASCKEVGDLPRPRFRSAQRTCDLEKNSLIYFDLLEYLPEKAAQAARRPSACAIRTRQPCSASLITPSSPGNFRLCIAGWREKPFGACGLSVLCFEKARAVSGYIVTGNRGAPFWVTSTSETTTARKLDGHRRFSYTPFQARGASRPACCQCQRNLHTDATSKLILIQVHGSQRGRTTILCKILGLSQA